MLTVAKVLQQTEQAQKDVEQGMFRTPPSDWPEFQRRLGMWCAYEAQIVELKSALKQEDD